MPQKNLLRFFSDPPSSSFHIPYNNTVPCRYNRACAGIVRFGVRRQLFHLPLIRKNLFPLLLLLPRRPRAQVRQQHELLVLPRQMMTVLRSLLNGVDMCASLLHLQLRPQSLIFFRPAQPRNNREPLEITARCLHLFISSNPDMNGGEDRL